MSSLAICPSGLFDFSSNYEGQSNDTKFIESLREGFRREKKNTVTQIPPSDLLLAEINDILLECNIVDWDGQGASAIPVQAAMDAELFLSRLPSDILMPDDATPTPDGSIDFEWYNKGNVVNIAFYGDGQIVYAGFFGDTDRDHGVKPNIPPLHSSIKQLIVRVTDDVRNRT